MRPADLFDEFAARHARGERPDAREYLERAGEGADELADLIDVLLRAAPVREPAPETVAMMEAVAAGEPPLLRLRIERGLTRADVVDALVRGLKVDFKKTAKVRRYYHELETGLLDPARVDARVFSVLAKALGARVADLVAWRPSLPEASPMYLRASTFAPAAAQLDFSLAAEASEEPDEVDRLFNATHRERE